MTRGRALAVYSLAAVTAVMGIGSLAVFGFFLWMGTFGLVELGMPRPYALGWDSLLCLLFFLQHSGMVRRSFRSRMAGVVPVHLHGVVYTVASAVALIVLVAFWQPLEGYRLQGAALWVSRCALIGCLAIILWGIRSLGNFDAFGTEALLSPYRGQQLETAALAIKGPYRLVRHPFYAAGVVALWASPVLSWDRLILNLLFTIWIVCGARLEERDLREQFGQDYRSYQRTVPMFIPDLLKPTSANRSNAISSASRAGD